MGGVKGQNVKQIIDKIKLRPETVLFIDDNHMNLEEVRYYVPKINVAGPEIIPYIKDDSHFVGKNDAKLTRLNQYKILEQKDFDSEKFESNEEFLFHSNICVEIVTTGLQLEIERIYELNQRTNQLNYTKNRCDLEEIRGILTSTVYSCGYVKVKDRYGEYGIVGFYAIKDDILEHFYFSCRTLGLGVEQYVYSYLGYPKINIVGEVATEIRINTTCPWINCVQPNKGYEDRTDGILDKKLKVLVCGGCDLEQTAFYLKQSTLSFDTMFNYVVDGRFETHPEELEILCQSYEFDEKKRKS